MPKYLSLDEVKQAIASLTEREKATLVMCARSQARKYGIDQDWEDLLQEARARVLYGTKQWPVGLKATTFFAGRYGVIPDVAKRFRSRRIEKDGILQPYSSNPDFVVDILRLFEDDPIAQEIVKGMMGFETGPIEQTAFERKRIKIKRRIMKYLGITKKDDD